MKNNDAKMTKKIPDELRNEIVCKISIAYGNDMADKECLKTLEHIKKVCDKYGIETAVEKQKRYCCSDYRVIKTNGFLSLNETEKFIKEVNLNIGITYRGGTFNTDYDNTYY